LIYNSVDYLVIKDNNKVNNLYMYSPTIAMARISIRPMVVEAAMNGVSRPLPPWRREHDPTLLPELPIFDSAFV